MIGITILIVLQKQDVHPKEELWYLRILVILISGWTDLSFVRTINISYEKVRIEDSPVRTSSAQQPGSGHCQKDHGGFDGLYMTVVYDKSVGWVMLRAQGHQFESQVGISCTCTISRVPRYCRPSFGSKAYKLMEPRRPE